MTTPGKSLLASFDSTQNAIKGEWELLGGQLRVDDPKMALAELPESLPRSYSLVVAFTRTAGDDSVGVVVPVGSRQCIVNLSAFGGEAHGIATVDGAIARNNTTTIRPGTLETGRRYQLDIDVSDSGGTASIRTRLNDKPFLEWSGNPEALDLLPFWKLPKTNTVGLFANSSVVFHSVTVRPSQNAESSSAKRTVVFEGRRWNIENARSAAVEKFAGRDALHIVGGETNFVPLVDETFTEGTIEVDVASSTFSGVGFHADKNLSVADLVYVRPFNSGTAKHENTIQYAMMGRPRFGWRSLREQFPGKFESGADVAVDEWFHLKVIIDKRTASVFINDGSEPVLTVNQLLGDQQTGLVGVWGWDTYISNFRVSATTK